jgi:hypothetical protein
MNSEFLENILSGIEMLLGCSVPDANSCSIGVNRKKLSSFTRVIFMPLSLPKNFWSRRSTEMPANPPPKIRIFVLFCDKCNLSLTVFYYEHGFLESIVLSLMEK